MLFSLSVTTPSENKSFPGC